MSNSTGCPPPHLPLGVGAAELARGRPSISRGAHAFNDARAAPPATRFPHHHESTMSPPLPPLDSAGANLLASQDVDSVVTVVPRVWIRVRTVCACVRRLGEVWRAHSCRPWLRRKGSMSMSMRGLRHA